MVRFVYNVIQNILILLLWPAVLLFVLSKAKYRRRFWLRCGFGLRATCKTLHGNEQRFWIHALSVGELSSVVSLVKALRKSYPKAVILVSTTSTAGGLYAKERLSGSVDAFVAFPYDHYLVVRYFLAVIRPHLFVQVETDFWPNFLAAVKGAQVPSFLVNGRVSLAGFRRYCTYKSLFLPMFNCFTRLGMQTQTDVNRMIELGIRPEKTCMPGNLKIDAAMPEFCEPNPDIVTPFKGKRLIVLGSTHPGEEEELAPVLDSVKMAYPDVRFIVAPREIERGREVAEIFESHGLPSVLRSENTPAKEETCCLIVDTMGELVHYYQLADIAFVGGSLRPFGGHNPLEPVAFGKPVLFGSHMEDFEDICAEMLQEQCAVQVENGVALGREIGVLLKNRQRCKELGQAGHDYIIKRQGVTQRHLDIITQLLTGTS